MFYSAQGAADMGSWGHFCPCFWGLVLLQIAWPQRGHYRRGRTPELPLTHPQTACSCFWSTETIPQWLCFQDLNLRTTCAALQEPPRKICCHDAGAQPVQFRIVHMCSPANQSLSWQHRGSLHNRQAISTTIILRRLQRLATSYQVVWSIPPQHWDCQARTRLFCEKL